MPQPVRLSSKVLLRVVSNFPFQVEGCLTEGPMAPLTDKGEKAIKDLFNMVDLMILNCTYIY